MNKIKFLIAFVCIIVITQDSSAQRRRPGYPEAMPGINNTYYSAFGSGNPYGTKDMLNHIRREKFDIILPRVMRERGIDMWIHIIRPWTWTGNEMRRLEGSGQNYSNIDSTDPLRYEFGTHAAVLVFTDRGGDRIERTVYEGEVDDEGAFDIVRGQSPFINQENYEIMDYVKKNPGKVPKSEMGYRFMGLGDFVAERDPKKIAVNYVESLTYSEGSETYTMALTDGISYADHLHLSKALGSNYAERMMSAEHLVLDYLTRTTMAEVVVLGGSARPPRPMTFPKIVPGVTTLRDANGSWFGTREADHNETAFSNFPLQLGDVICDGTVPIYILREGETEPPPEIQRHWDEVVQVRNILAKHIKSGMTGNEALELVIEKLEEAGFSYIDRDRYDPTLDPTKSQVHLDLHQVGKGVLAPRVSPMGSSWQSNKKIPLFLTLGVEYMVHSQLPERGKGHHIYNCTLHERGVVTPRGIEFAAALTDGYISIR